MFFSLEAIAKYQREMDALDPAGQPTARVLHRGTKEPGRRVGILDASFNPMTLAHEALLTVARQTYHLDEMLLMLSRSNVDKELSGAGLGARLAMLMLYAQEKENVSVGICSHARFVDKIAALKQIYPDGTGFFFLVGYDTLLRLFDEKYYVDMETELRALFETCHFIAADRDANAPETLRLFLQKKEILASGAAIHPIELPGALASISSTQIRNEIQKNASIENLVPQSISRAIRRLGLYVR
ncbi:MAG: nicotinate-nicotinamide nucleotide adenylyltransferase [bacterium]|jgi:nicotinate (nicotinamide) nucleotide adenylyltransferase|nr:nicotinate-nicotinamide nucleotide adenylyltransferase [bacterium]